MGFLGKRAIVTGGTAGLGEACVRALVREGARVMFCGLLDEEGARVEAELGGHARYIRADVRDSAAIEAFISTATEQLGGVDLAVNNAGISHKSARFADLDLPIVDDVWRTNVMGVWHAMRAEIHHMKANGGGAIVNVASILSEQGAPWMAAYGTSKYAVIGMTKSAALDYVDDNIRINAISPGPMLTPMFERALADIAGDMSKFAGGLPPGGPVRPEEVAQSVLYLLSEQAEFVTGTNLVVDGATSAG